MGASGNPLNLCDRLLSLFFSFFSLVSSLVHHHFVYGDGLDVGTTSLMTSLRVLTRLLTAGLMPSFWYICLTRLRRVEFCC